MGSFVSALGQGDILSFLLTHSYQYLYKLTSFLFFSFSFLYHSNFQLSGVLPSAFGQFELSALDKKKTQSPLCIPCDAIILRKGILKSERYSGYLEQLTEWRIFTRTSLVVPRVYGQWI